MQKIVRIVAVAASMGLGLSSLAAQTVPASPTPSTTTPIQPQSFQPRRDVSSAQPKDTPTTSSSDPFAGRRCKTLFCTVGLLPDDYEPKPDRVLNCGPLCSLLGLAPNAPATTH